MRLNGRWQKDESMGEKDITEKLLMDYNDVFADIVNVLLFDGEERIKDTDLETTSIRSQYKADTGEMHEQERDVAKLLKKEKVIISLIGIENQTKPDKYEPIRVLSYDGQSYRTQLLDKKAKSIYPVITLVLYFGTDPWSYSHNLKDIVKAPEWLKPYISDYEIKNLFEISYLTPEKVKLFKSDFRMIADYFVQLRMNEEYTPTREIIEHVDAYMKMMTVLTGNRKFEEEIPAVENKTGGTTMIDVFDQMEKKGQIKVYVNELHYTPKEISIKMGLPEKEVSKLIEGINRETKISTSKK